MEEDKENIVESLAKELLEGMDDEKKGKEDFKKEPQEEPKEEMPSEIEEEPPLPTFEEPSFKTEEPALPTFEEKAPPFKIEEPTLPTFEEEAPPFKIEEPTLPTFEEPSFKTEEPALPTFEEETPIPSEAERPSSFKIEEMLAKLEEEEKGVGLEVPEKVEEEEEEEEFGEPEIKDEEEILVRKPIKRKIGGRFVKFAILGCILGGVVGGIFYFGKEYYKPIINLVNIKVVNKIFKPFCDLIVASNPPSCDLFVDDIIKGKTPITIKKLSSGSHNLRLEKEGFKPWTDTIDVVSRKPINIIAELEPEIKIEEVIFAGTATLIVVTSPKDAIVYIDGKLAKMPYSLLSGAHSVRVEKEGFFKFVKTLEIKPQEVKEAFVRLQPSLGSIFIDSIPRRVDIVFDGSFRGKTPLILTSLSPWKPFRITIIKDGYFNWNGTTFVEPNQRTRVMAFMKKKGEETSLIEKRERFVEKEPFYKKKEKEIEEPAIFELNRAIDRFGEDVKVSYPIIQPFVEEPYLKREFPESKKEKPSPKTTGGPGTCFITSIPAGADIFLNGKFIGKTPIRDFIMQEGRYELKASLAGFKEQKKEIIVSRETPNFFNISLKN